jgi:TrmH family RNA methyltransferase
LGKDFRIEGIILEPLSIKNARRLREKKFRIEHKMTLIEGPKVVKDVSKKIEPNFIYVDRRMQEKFKNTIQEIKKDKAIPVVYISSEDMKELSDTKKNMGIIGAFPIKIPEKVVSPVSENAFLFFQTQDPTNLGNIVRSAVWFGIQSIYLYESVDIFNPKVIRSSVGAVFAITPYIVKELDNFLRGNQGHELVALTEKGDIPLSGFEFPQRAIYVFGNEGKGITKDLLDKVNNRVFIEGTKKIDSLNLQTSFSIFAHNYFLNKRND